VVEKEGRGIYEGSGIGRDSWLEKQWKESRELHKDGIE